MHELSLASAVVDTVERHADGRRVSVVSLRIGTLRQVVPPSLEFYFDLVGRETVCEDARLEIEVVPAEARCRACGEEWTLAGPVFRCADCGRAGVEILAGEEFDVESIVVIEEEPCIALT